MKRSIITILALTALALGVKADPNGESNFVPWAPKHDNGVKALEAEIAALQKEITQVKSTNAALQRQVNLIASNPALQLGPFVSVDPNTENNVIGPNIVFKGANIHIESGSGATDDNGTLLSLGNLFIGYNEPSIPFVNIPKNGPRMGSHNLIVGRYNIFRNAFGGLVTGENNFIQGEAQSIVGGFANLIQDGSTNSVIVGGRENAILASYSAIVGGAENEASGNFSVALGGFRCFVNGYNAVTLGGIDDRLVGASGSFSVTSFNTINVVQP